MSHNALHDFILGRGIKHFSGREVCTLRRLGVTVDPPPVQWWDRMIPTLELAEEIRARVGHPLVVGNGYRPDPQNRMVGGARRSKHKYFRALDLDLPKGYNSHAHQTAFYTAACAVFLEHGYDAKMGLGLYRPWRGTRVHIDAGSRRRYWRAKYVRPILDSMR